MNPTVTGTCLAAKFEDRLHYSNSTVLQELKNIKNVKGCRDGMLKSMQTR